MTPTSASRFNADTIVLLKAFEATNAERDDHICAQKLNITLALVSHTNYDINKLVEKR